MKRNHVYVTSAIVCLLSALVLLALAAPVSVTPSNIVLKDGSGAITVTSVYCGVLSNYTSDGYVQVYRMLVENGSSFPAVASSGFLFLRTDWNVLTFYNGTDWTNCTGGGVSGGPYLLASEATNLLFTNGTQPLTADWNAGAYGVYGCTWVNSTSINSLNYYLNNNQLGFVQPATFIIDVSGSTYRAWHGANSTLFTSSTNASAVINNAIGNLTSGRTWQETVVLKGNFTLTACGGTTYCFSLPSYTQLKIDGQLTLGSNQNVNLIEIASNAYYVTIQGGYLFGNNVSNTLGSGIFINTQAASSQDLISGVTIKYFAEHGIFCDARKVAIKDSDIWYSGNNGIRLNASATDTLLFHNLIEYSGAEGIFNNGACYTQIIDCACDRSAQNATYASEHKVALGILDGSDILIVGGYYEWTAGFAGVYIQGNSFRNVLDGLLVINNVGYAIYDAAGNNTITNCNIYDDRVTKLQTWAILTGGGVHWDIITNNQVDPLMEATGSIWLYSGEKNNFVQGNIGYTSQRDVSQTFVVTVGENVTVGDILFHNSTGYFRAKALSSATLPTYGVYGIATENATLGNICLVVTSGHFTYTVWNWDVTLPLYVSNSTFGGMMQTYPSNSGAQSEIVGQAISTTTILFNPKSVVSIP